MQQQQQQQQQDNLIQQPFLTDNVTSGGPAPYIRRGFKITEGVTCSGSYFVPAGILGLISFLTGFTIVSFTGSRNEFFMVMTMLGALVAILSGFFCLISKAEFNALPPDHPDRAKYSGNPVLPQRPTTTTIYQLPLGAQVVYYPSTSPGGQVVDYPSASPGGQVASYPSTSPGGQVVDYPLSPVRRTENFTPSAPIPPVGTRTDDLPPSYEDAVEISPYK